MLGGEYVGLIDERLVTYFSPEHSPGGIAYQDRQALSSRYHSYCGTDFKSGSPDPWRKCALFMDRSLDVQGAARKRLGGAGLLTEFGAVGYSKNSIKLVEKVVSMMDDALQGWNYWQFKSFDSDDITTTSSTSNPFSETFYHINGALQREKIDALIRTYAQAIAGRPILHKLSKNKSLFELVYEPRLRIGASGSILAFRTEMFFHGIPASVLVTPQGVATFSVSGKKLVVEHKPSKLATVNKPSIHVTVRF